MTGDSCGTVLYSNHLEEDDLSLGLRLVNEVTAKYELPVRKAISGGHLDDTERAVIREFDRIPLIYSLVLSVPIIKSTLLIDFAKEMRLLKIPKPEEEHLSLDNRISTCEEMKCNIDCDSKLETMLIRRLENKINVYYVQQTKAALYKDLRVVKEVCVYFIVNGII